MFQHEVYGTFNTYGKNRVTLTLTGIAFDDEHLIALSAVGPSVAAQAVFAQLVTDGQGYVTFNRGNRSRLLQFPPLENGSKAFSERRMLPYLRQMHLTMQSELMFGKQPPSPVIYAWENQLTERLLLTIPVALPAQWVPEVIQSATNAKMIARISCYGCSVYRILADTERWSEFISAFATGRNF